MADYTRTDGGTIMIRDTGTIVEYWFKSNNTAAWYNNLSFSWTTSVATATADIDYPTGSPWVKVGQSDINASQNVTFRQTDNTTVAGIGPAKTLTAYINRGTVPPQPGPFSILSYSDVAVVGDADGNGTGGATPLEWDLRYGTAPNVNDATGNGNLVLSTGAGQVEDLVPGLTYYFWNRIRNVNGWSPWSPRTQVRTRSKPDPPDSPSMIWRTQNSIQLKIVPNYNGDNPIHSYRLRWGLNPDEPTAQVVSTSNIITIGGLSPGATYYFWGTAINGYGESFYSPRNYAQLIAGAKVKVGSVWKRAVPYVKVDGVWKLARPWGKIAGFWNETPE